MASDRNLEKTVQEETQLSIQLVEINPKDNLGMLQTWISAMDGITVHCNKCGAELWYGFYPELSHADNAWRGAFLNVHSKPFIFVDDQKGYDPEKICVNCYKEKHSDTAGEAELHTLVDQILFYGHN